MRRQIGAEHDTPNPRTHTPRIVLATILIGLVLIGVAFLWTHRGGALNDPEGVATSPAGTVYVLDAGHNRVVEMSPAGTQMHTWNTNPKHYGDADAPYALAVDRYGTVFVTASGCHPGPFLSGNCTTVHQRLDVFSSHGTRLLPATESLYVSTDPDGNAYTCDPTPLHGLHVRALPAVACSSSTEWANVDTYILNRHGQVLEAMPDSGSCPCAYVLANSCGVHGAHCDPGDPWKPIDAGDKYGGDSVALATDRLGTVYVAETPPGDMEDKADRVAVIDKHGKVRAVWTGFGNITGLAVATNGDVYITDADQNALEKYSPGGKRIASW